MNLLVTSPDLPRCSFRPDTTLEKFSRDFYVPHGVEWLGFTPVVFAGIAQAGKAVAPRFSQRYYEEVNFGLLLYDGTLLDEASERSYAEASVLDHSSILPYPLRDASAAAETWILYKNGQEIFRSAEDRTDWLRAGICKASERTFLRRGDLLIAELAPIRPLFRSDEQEARIEAQLSGEKLLDFRIII